MATKQASGKRFQIDKANSRVVIILAIAAFVATFSVISSKALITQRNYQARVIAEKTKTAKTLKANLTSANTLAESYRNFVSTPQNVLGGSPQGQADNDGDNAKIVLDALPSKYDFPALAASLEKILLDRQLKINGITGSDDELAQGNVTSPAPQPVDMPFEIAVTSSYDSVQVLFDILGRSIRPFQVTELNLTGTTDNVTLNLSAKTFYQPEKNLNITTKVVK